MRLRALPLTLALVGCSISPPPEGSAVRCAADSECPPDARCVDALALCGFNAAPQLLAASLSPERALGVGQRATLEFSLAQVPAATPRASFVDADGRARAFELNTFDVDQTGALNISGDYTIVGDEGDGAFDVELTAGEALLFTDTLEIDPNAPREIDATFLVEGATSELSLLFDEPVSVEGTLNGVEIAAEVDGAQVTIATEHDERPTVYEFVLVARDLAGNVIEIVRTFDIDAPEPTLPALPARLCAVEDFNTARFDVSVDLDTVLLAGQFGDRALPCEFVEPGLYRCTLVVSDDDPEGAVALAVSATDGFGNVGQDLATLIVDKSPPSVSAVNVVITPPASSPIVDVERVAPGASVSVFAVFDEEVAETSSVLPGRADILNVVTRAATESIIDLDIDVVAGAELEDDGTLSIPVDAEVQDALGNAGRVTLVALLYDERANAPDTVNGLRLVREVDAALAPRARLVGAADDTREPGRLRVEFTDGDVVEVAELDIQPGDPFEVLVAGDPTLASVSFIDRAGNESPRALVEQVTVRRPLAALQDATLQSHESLTAPTVGTSVMAEFLAGSARPLREDALPRRQVGFRERFATSVLSDSFRGGVYLSRDNGGVMELRRESALGSDVLVRTSAEHERFRLGYHAPTRALVGFEEFVGAICVNGHSAFTIFDELGPRDGLLVSPPAGGRGRQIVASAQFMVVSGGTATSPSGPTGCLNAALGTRDFSAGAWRPNSPVNIDVSVQPVVDLVEARELRVRNNEVQTFGPEGWQTLLARDGARELFSRDDAIYLISADASGDVIDRLDNEGLVRITQPQGVTTLAPEIDLVGDEVLVVSNIGLLQINGNALEAVGVQPLFGPGVERLAVTSNARPLVVGTSFGAFVYGGATNGSSVPFQHRFESGSFIQLSAPPEVQREGAALASAENELVLFGGVQLGVDEMNDLWALELGTGLWRELHAGGAGAPPLGPAHIVRVLDDVLYWNGSATWRFRGDQWTEVFDAEEGLAVSVVDLAVTVDAQVVALVQGTEGFQLAHFEGERWNLFGPTRDDVVPNLVRDPRSGQLLLSSEGEVFETDGAQLTSLGPGDVSGLVASDGDLLAIQLATPSAPLDQRLDEVDLRAPVERQRLSAFFPFDDLSLGFFGDALEVRVSSEDDVSLLAWGRAHRFEPVSDLGVLDARFMVLHGGAYVSVAGPSEGWSLTQLDVEVDYRVSP